MDGVRPLIYMTDVTRLRTLSLKALRSVQEADKQEIFLLLVTLRKACQPVSPGSVLIPYNRVRLLIVSDHRSISLCGDFQNVRVLQKRFYVVMHGYVQ